MTATLTRTPASAIVRLAPRANIGGRGQVANYLNVHGDAIRSCERFTIRVVLYGARSACGLISEDRNGIAVLCENRNTVIADDMFLEPMGAVHGPSLAQVAAFEQMLNMPEDELEELINSSSRLRMPL